MERRRGRRRGRRLNLTTREGGIGKPVKKKKKRKKKNPLIFRKIGGRLVKQRFYVKHIADSLSTEK